MDLLFLFLVTFVLGFWICKKMNEWKSLPPGPWGLPILGYLPFMDRHKPHLTLTNLSKVYGSIYGLSMGSIYTVVLSDHKLIREAFAKDVFSGRAPLYLTHGLMKGFGIICSEGARWKDQRKLITSYLKTFGMSKISSSREKLQKRIAMGVIEVVSVVKENLGSPVDLSTLITHSLGNVVNDLIFGCKFPPHDKVWHWLREIQEEGCHEMGVAGAVNFLPFVRFISPSTQKSIEVLSKGQAQTHRLYASIIAKRRKELGLTAPEKAKYPLHENIFKEHPKGFIKYIQYSKNMDSYEENYFDPDILISSGEECILDNYLLEQNKRFENEEDSAMYATDEQLLHLLCDMFGAGLDTTASTLNWFLLYMAMHPKEQELVRKEILEVYPEQAEIDTAKLPYLMAAISEVQRIRSIVPVGIPHGATEDTYIGDYRIPKGTMVMPLQWAIHMDPTVWENPEEFKPSRFIDENGTLLKPQEFIPFQTGKRMCPGDELSRMISTCFIVYLFRSVRLSLASDPPTEKELEGQIGLTLAPPKVLFRCEAV
ncbi:cytochrome P450 306a1 [Aricia agestis]|uniref:cytochrome P450 306a1 n=1 Tax=Aricia agestis TaxID=91739 RepID=UPI001C209581|nr:cytochrome P450 306a1 [Aricia agestis]